MSASGKSPSKPLDPAPAEVDPTQETIDRIRQLVVGDHLDEVVQRVTQLETAMTELRAQLEHRIESTAATLRSDDGRAQQSIARTEQLVATERSQRCASVEALARQLEGQASRLSEHATRIEQVASDLSQRQARFAERLSRVEDVVEPALAEQQRELAAQRRALDEQRGALSGWQVEQERLAAAIGQKLDGAALREVLAFARERLNPGHD